MKKKTILLSSVLLISIVLLSKIISGCASNKNKEQSNPDLPIDEIGAVVVAPREFIIKDDMYSAEILVGVKKTSVDPTIYLTYQSPFYEEYEEDGETKYRLLKNGDYEEVPVDKDGKGIYKTACLSHGDFNYGGLIHYELESGDIWLPFESHYIVGSTGFNVTGPDAYVIYRGEENLINVSVSGYPLEMINVSIDHGSISPAEFGKFKVIVNGDYDKVVVSLAINTGDGVKELGEQEFVVRDR